MSVMESDLLGELHNQDLTSVLFSDICRVIEEQEVEELDLNETAEGFSIKSAEQANYFIRKLKEIRDQREVLTAQSQKVIDSYTLKVQRYLDDNSKPLNNQELFYLAILEEYAKQEHASNPKVKTLKFIEGTLAFKKQQPEFNYDEAALKEFLLADPALKKDYINIKTEEVPKKVEIKKAGTVVKGKLTIAGKVIDGITITDRPDKFEVK